MVVLSHTKNNFYDAFTTIKRHLKVPKKSRKNYNPLKIMRFLMCDKEDNFIACDTLVKIIAYYDDVYKKNHTHTKKTNI